MRVLAIDFGTSNTVAMLRTADGRMRPLLFDGSPMLPSAVYLDADGRMLVGRDAERHARLDPARFESNPKRCIDDGHILLGDAAMPVQQVFGHVLTHIANESRRQLGGAPEEVRLTHPARWGERRRSLLVDGARMAGLSNPRMIAEPVGAASYFTAVLGAAVPIGRSLAIYDLGGGTFDATVVRRTQSGFEVLAEEGLADVGGLDFDHAIVEYLGKSHEASHPQLWAQLTKPTDANDRRHRRLLYEDVRAAKEMLSRTSSTDIHLPALEVDAHLTREELETLVRPLLERTVACLRLAIDAARLNPAELVGIFLVGGSSRIPLAAHLIHTELGVAPTTLEQPETVVVEGALCIGASLPAGAGQAGVSGLPRTVSAAPGRPGAPAARPVSAQPVRPAAGRPLAGPAPARPMPVATPMQPAVPPAGPAGARPGGPGVNPNPPVSLGRPPNPAPQPVQPVQPIRPASGPPAPAVQPVRPASGPPAPAAPRPGPQPPQILRPAGTRPPQAPAPVNTAMGQPAAVRPTSVPPAVNPPPVQLRPMPARPVPASAPRPKYTEPAVVATVVVLALVVIAFVTLLVVFSGG